MKVAEVRGVAAAARTALDGGDVDAAFAALAPWLGRRVPFTALDRLGALLAEAPPRALDPLLDRVAAARAIGSWPVIGAALATRLPSARAAAFARTRGYVVQADVWYGADILGERVVGPSLVQDLPATLRLLAAWRDDENRWVRRAIGVGVHVWAKRAAADRAHERDAARILAFVRPMFWERDLDVVKGVGWGLKTIGRRFPALLAGWLTEVRADAAGRRAHPTMLRKALTYLPAAERARVTRVWR